MKYLLYGILIVLIVFLLYLAAFFGLTVFISPSSSQAAVNHYVLVDENEKPLSSLLPHGHSIVEPLLKFETGEAGGKQVALTLDACSGATDYRILNVLVAERIPATLFVTGRWVRNNGGAVAIINAHPDLFEVENHGAEHVPAITGEEKIYGLKTAGTLAAVEQEVRGGVEVITRAFGTQPVWYRGATARYSYDAVRKIEGMGYKVAGYSLNGDKGASLPASVVAKRFEGARDGDVIIAHINQPKRPSGEGVVQGILALKKQKVRFRLLRDVKTRAGTAQTLKT